MSHNHFFLGYKKYDMHIHVVACRDGNIVRKVFVFRVCFLKWKVFDETILGIFQKWKWIRNFFCHINEYDSATIQRKPKSVVNFLETNSKFLSHNRKRNTFHIQLISFNLLYSTLDVHICIERWIVEWRYLFSPTLWSCFSFA